MKILEEGGFSIFMVGGGGMGVSHQTDSHTYIIHSGGEYALIDTGSGIKPELIQKNLEQDGIAPSSISTILLTHSHWDHARGCAFWKKVTGAKVAAHEDAVDTLEKNLWPNLHLAKHGIGSHKTKVDIALKDGAAIKVGRLKLEVLHSHGHSHDSICIFTSFGSHRVLFSGDTVFAEGGHGTVNADTDFKKYRASVKRLAQYEVSALLPGHKQFVLAYGNEHINLLDKKLSGNWTDVMTARVPFFPTWCLENDPCLYDDARKSANLMQANHVDD